MHYHDPKPPSPQPNRPLTSSSHPIPLASRASEESIRTEFCDGFMPDVPPLANDAGDQAAGLDSQGPSQKQAGVCTSDRNVYMESVKRGENATWVPKQTQMQIQGVYSDRDPSFAPSPYNRHEPNALLPSAEFHTSSTAANDRYATELSPPQEIKRPQSALHAGDFTRDSSSPIPASQQLQSSLEPSKLSTPAATGALLAGPWDIPPQPHHDSDVVSPIPERPISQTLETLPPRSRAPSLTSLSSSYVVKEPTTPLVQQSNNTDLDFTPMERSISPSKSNRRHTLPPRPFNACGEWVANNRAAPHALEGPQSPLESSVPSFPHRAHRYRRSLTTTWSLQGSPSPQKSSVLSSRRQSFSSEAFPLQHASMVGSYEESILRGRMSTAPSKPLDFTAHIGVMGKGSYKPKCPAHVAIPFPAVFYSWNGSDDRKSMNIDDEPSPYVGHIDLSQLAVPAESNKTRRSGSKPRLVDEGHSFHLQDETIPQMDKNAENRGHKKRRRTSPAPSTLQGGYRIPQKGQLQIIIKNPHKTAVKLFLVPYDLEDMPAQSKTFIRQRCYSADAVFDGLHASGADLSFGSVPPKGKPILRYLIHVNICSPSSGRFYLYQTIRVVFANRVPDNKEQLQTEIQTPQPRYSAYSSVRSLSGSVSSSDAGLARDKAFRRCGSGFGIGSEGTDDRHPQAFVYGTHYPSNLSLQQPVAGVPRQFQSTQTSVSPFPMGVAYGVGKDPSGGNGEGSPFPIFGNLPASPTPVFPATSIPIHRSRFRRKDPDDQRIAGDVFRDIGNSSRPTTSSSQQTLPSPLSDKTNQQGLHSKRSDLSQNSGESNPYSKLGRWDVGYGGRPSTPVSCPGLLTKKLKGLGGQMVLPMANGDEMDEQ
ncbi:MAG: hypothetical protein Q9169_000930 [Polycauliona sp. 2 TL-2023]